MFMVVVRAIEVLHAADAWSQTITPGPRHPIQRVASYPRETGGPGPGNRALKKPGVAGGSAIARLVQHGIPGALDRLG